MFLKAGAVSLVLLLASRVLGLLRESAQAAAFGATAAGDISVLMLHLPDLVASVFASGALAYVLLPAWARESPAQVAARQRQVAAWLLGLGGLLALALWGADEAMARWLLPGLPADQQLAATRALGWSAAALPSAFLAALWVTRLQHERDFLGAYGANVVANGCVVAVLLWLAARPGTAGSQALAMVGGGLLAAMLGRLVWLRWRLRPWSSGAGGPVPTDSAPALRRVVEPQAVSSPAADTTSFPLWLWALGAAGLPLALPFAARSLASQGGAGDLAIFNYAWKLVELPLQLAIQLVATLALGPIAQALAQGESCEAAATLIRRGFALAWTLACACAAALLVAAPALAQLLFGWGRMQPEALAQVAEWGRLGAWSLLPQALSAVGLAVLAARRQLRWGALAHGLALALLLVLAPGEGASLMRWLVALYAAVGLGVLVAIGPSVRRWLPARALGAGAAGLGLAWGLAAWLPAAVPMAPGLLLALVAASLPLGFAWTAAPELRQALRR